MTGLSIKQFLCGVVLLGGCPGWMGGVQAGVLLTKTRQAQVGEITETEAALSLQSQFGKVEFKKENLAWWSTDKSIDTLFKAAQKAKEQGNAHAAQALFELSAAGEPATKAQSEAEIQVIKASVVATAVAGLSGNTNAPAPTATLTPEQKIEQGQQLIDQARAEAEAKKPASSFATAPGGTIKLGETAPGTVAMNKPPPAVDIPAMEKKETEAKIKEGQTLIAEGQQALAQTNAPVETATALPKPSAPAPAPSIQVTFDFSDWTTPEKLVTGGIGVVFALVVLAALWQITMRHAKN